MGVSCVGVVSCVGFGGLGCLILKGDSSCYDLLTNIFHLCANKQSRLSPYAADSYSTDSQFNRENNSPTPLELVRELPVRPLPLLTSLPVSPSTSSPLTPSCSSGATSILRPPLHSPLMR
tara:strand:+ start:5310 stop:5669 length:360 start_codon:yes stop_codon:yes gene_type:complete